jgi:hypothetical protein
MKGDRTETENGRPLHGVIQIGAIRIVDRIAARHPSLGATRTVAIRIGVHRLLNVRIVDQIAARHRLQDPTSIGAIRIAVRRRLYIATRTGVIRTGVHRLQGLRIVDRTAARRRSRIAIRTVAIRIVACRRSRDEMIVDPTIADRSAEIEDRIEARRRAATVDRR